MTSILHTPAILVNMFKMRVERDSLWLEKNYIVDMPKSEDVMCGCEKTIRVPDHILTSAIPIGSVKKLNPLRL